MMLKKLKPKTSGTRQLTYVDFSQITKKRPEKSLIYRINKNAGRSSLTGRISVRHQGGGAKKLYRKVNFKQIELDQTAKVLAIEYDPYRSCFIALIKYLSDQKKSYILAPHELKVDDEIVTSTNAPVKIGNRMLLKNIPIGTAIHNIELRPGQGGVFVRSAGNLATIIAKDPPYAHVKLPSGELRKISLDCFGSVGNLSNPEHNLVTIGKAGRVRHMGIRPTVRGKAMYPAAHPHGGGEGVNPIGLKHPKTKWGKPAHGVKTRRQKKYQQLIISRRTTQ